MGLFAERPVVTAAAQKIESDAFAALKLAATGSNQSKEEFRAWFGQVRNRQRAAEPLSVLEHTVATYALRTRFMENDASAPEMKEALRDSWQSLTGRSPKPEQLLERLPRKVLKRETREIQLFHAAAFQNLPPNGAAKEAKPWRDYLASGRDFLAVAGAAMIASHPTGRDILGGALLGYSVSTFVEHTIHRYLAHSPKSLMDRFKKWGKIGRDFLKLEFSHNKVHHRWTFTEEYWKQFRDQEHQNEVDHQLEEAGVAEEVKQSRYGLSLTDEGSFTGAIPPLLVVAPIMSAVGYTATQLGAPLGLPFFLTAIPVSLIHLPASKYFHPYLHMKKEDALKEAGPLMRWFLRTRYAAMMSRLHYGHHAGRGGNYNLVFGADALLNMLRLPTVKQLLAMRDEELLY